ncbi:uncharacterized protein LOC142664494 isoform X2 [Rhinoderma darwinii]|uniref:uncharacterized protein LOC142664494 isoform X2 n=1 Tax=Rhinoderma darwinii TaxID=43563 RepID=UPI003F66334C
MPRALYVEKLIRLVQERPELWDTRAESYHDRTAKELAWDHIAQSLFSEEWAKSTTCDRNRIDDVETRWRSTRDQFRREYGARGRSGDGASKKRRHLYTQQLMFLNDIMEMRATSDSLDDSEEEPAHEESQAPVNATPLLPLTPEPTPQEPAPLASSPEHVPTNELRQHPAAARRRRSHMPSAGAQVDGRFLEYLRHTTDEEGYVFFCRSLAPLLRKVPDHRLARLQAAIITLIDSATPPNNPRQCFYAIEHWRGLPEPSVGYNVPGPSQPATPSARQHQYRPLPARFSPGPVAARERHFPTYSRAAETYPPPLQSHGYLAQHQHHYAVEEHPLQARGHNGAEMSAYTSPPDEYHVL